MRFAAIFGAALVLGPLLAVETHEHAGGSVQHSGKEARHTI